MAQLGATLAGLRDDVSAAQQAQAAAREAMAVEARTGISGETLGRWAAYGEALGRREATLAAESARVAEAVLRARDELLERHREERKLERLQERARARAGEAEARDEARLLDDLALRARWVGEGR